MTDVPGSGPDGERATALLHSRKEFLRRSVASAAIVAGGGSLLAACGGDDDRPSSDSASTSASGAATAAAQLTLLNWHTATPKVGLGKGFIEAGKAYEAITPKQTVKFQTKPFAAYVAAATAACRAKQLASNQILLPALNHAKLFPCTHHVTEESAGDLFSELTGWGDAAVTPGDTSSYAGYPMGGQGTLFYYNKALFEQAGLDPEAAPTTFDELANCCEKLKAKGIEPIGISGKDSYTPWWIWNSFLSLAYPTIEDVNAFINGEQPFDSPGTIAALNAVKETYDRGWWGAGFKDKGFAEIEADFVGGKVAIAPGIITDIMSWTVWDAKLGKEKYGVFAAPVIEGVKATSPTQNFNIAVIASVSADAESPETADNFARYLASKEGATLLLQSAGQFPNRTDVDVEAVSGSAGAARIQEILGEGQVVPAVTTWLNSTAVGAAIPKVTSAVTGGDVNSFVSSIQKLQEQEA